MGMGTIVSRDWTATPSGLLIPAYPSYYQRNQQAAWIKYFSDRAQLWKYGRENAKMPEDYATKIYAAVDIETHDPDIDKFGPGALRGIGHILGVGVYCPQLHIDDYLDYTDTRVKELLGRSDVVCIFHNAVYDLDWLSLWAQFPIHCRIEDTMTRESLLDTYSPSFKLDYCCKKYGIEGKNKNDTIDAWWEEHGGKGKAIKNLVNIPRAVVGKYCKQDCHAT